MNILHMICSSRAESQSTLFSKEIVERLLIGNPEASIVIRNLSHGAMPHVDEAYSTALTAMVDHIEDRPTGSLALSDTLIAELEHADMVVIGTPMHNFTVPSVLKAWIDHVVRVHRTFKPTPGGKVGLLQDRPVFVVIAAGGKFSSESAGQPDFLRPYLAAALATIGLLNVTFISLEALVFGAEAVAHARSMAFAALEQRMPVTA